MSLEMRESARVNFIISPEFRIANLSVDSFDRSLLSVSNDALTKFKGLHRVADEKLHLFDTWFDRNGTVLLSKQGFSDQMSTRTDLLMGEVPTLYRKCIRHIFEVRSP